MKKKNFSEELISVIIPTYNRAWCIERAIESILKQTYPYWELIIVDDGSTDTTKEVISKYLENKKIKYVRFKKNRGVNFARNKGFDLARGNYIALLDSDDELKLKALNIITTEFKKIKKRQDIGALLFNCENDEGKAIGTSPDNHSIITLKDWIEGNKFSGEKYVAIRGDLIKKDYYRFPYLRGQMESFLWLQIAQKYKFLFVNKVVRKYYTKHSSRLTGTGQMIRKAKYQQAVYKQFLKRFKKDYLKYNPRGLSKIYLEKGLNEIIAKKNKDGKGSIINSIKYNRSKLPLVFTLYILSFLPNKLFIKLAKFGHRFKRVLK